VKNSWGQTTQHSSKGTVEGSYTGKTKGYGGIVSTGAISCQCARIDGRRTTSHNRQRELAEKSKYKLEAQSRRQEQGAHMHILMHICTFQAVHTHSAGTKRRAPYIWTACWCIPRPSYKQPGAQPVPLLFPLSFPPTSFLLRSLSSLPPVLTPFARCVGGQVRGILCPKLPQPGKGRPGEFYA
jgi:hypothetical protein